MQPLVSIVIPTYGRPISLRRTVISALTQTYTNIEIIIVDDNNPNTQERYETKKVMSEFLGHTNVTYIQHETNRNGAAARNTGWRFGHGEYITFLDDDDQMLPQKIEKQVYRLESLDESWGACYCAYHLIKPNGKRQYSVEKREGYLYKDALMRTLYICAGSNMMLRISAVKQVQGYDESFTRNQDIEFLARIAELYKIAYVDDDLLEIDQNPKRKKYSFAQYDGFARHYIDSFHDRITSLPEKDQKEITDVISLERGRVALYSREYVAMIKILYENKVGVIKCMRYVTYLINRFLTRKSYGFH